MISSVIYEISLMHTYYTLVVCEPDDGRRAGASGLNGRGPHRLCAPGAGRDVPGDTVDLSPYE
jgi:hypothetical protein